MKRKKSAHGKSARDSPPIRQKRGAFAGVLLRDWDCIPEGYAPLSRNPEVRMAVGRIADLISSMPIHVMENGDGGDIRIHDGLARKLDIEPNPYMTRKTFIAAVIWSLLLDGSGNSIVAVRTSPHDDTQWIDSLHPVPPERVSFLPAMPEGYRILVDGVPVDPSGLLHFVLNPSPSYPWRGTGFRISLRSVVRSLSQEDNTKNAFLASKYNPTLIVRVNSEADELSTETGRRNILKQYVETSQAGEPWILPADLMDVQQAKPLTLNDLAISDSVKLDRQSVAAILGVPPFLVGAGTYNKAEWNHFVSTTLMPIVRGIEQEMTRKLILSPRRYVRFNAWALYAYELSDLADIGANLYAHGLMTGNNVRHWLGLPPMEGLDELVILENYIPAGRIGDQKKLKNLKKSLSEGDDDA